MTDARGAEMSDTEKANAGATGTPPTPAEVTAMTETKTPDEAGKKKRPWWRLHRSTWAVVFLAFIIFVGISYPGFLSLESIQPGSAHFSISHGWPWSFLERTDLESIYSFFSYFDYDLPYRGCWTFPCAWSLQGEWLRYSILCLIADILVLFVIFAVIAFYFERRRRRGIRLWQCTIRELLTATLFVALGLSYWSYHHNRRLVITAYFDNTVHYPGEKYVCPELLVRIFGYWYLEDFRTASVLSIGVNELNAEDFAKILTAMPYIESLRFRGDDLLNEDVFYALHRCSSLRELDIGAIEESNDLLRTIRSTPQLHSLQLMNVSLSSSCMDMLVNLDQLETLSICMADADRIDLIRIGNMKQLQHFELKMHDLNDTDIVWLGKMRQLKKLIIRDTNVSSEGIEKLKKLLPECVIESDFPDTIDDDNKKDSKTP